MKPLLSMFFLLGLLMFHQPTHAEGICPPGMIPYSNTGINSCGPIPGYDQQQTPPSPATPPTRWESPWGAIAIGTVGGVGVAINMPNAQMAEQSALAGCREKGGMNCKIEVSYANGCAVVVSGDKLHNSISGKTLAKATQKAMKTCNAVDTNCQVILKICSPSDRAQ